VTYQSAWQSGDVGDGESAVLSARVAGEGKIGFWWKVSCEKYKSLKLDYLEFSIDGVAQDPWINGETDWTYLEFSVAGEGEHVLRWIYAKDDDGKDGQDCGWVTGIRWVRTMSTLADYLNCGNLTFTTSGNAEWMPDLTVMHDGVASLRSGAIGDNQVSCLETVVTNSGTISFWWNVSCESYKSLPIDKLIFRVDGAEITAIGSTSLGWTHYTYEVKGNGAHAIVWEYVKDESGFDGEDCGWLDEVCWQPNDPIPDLGDNPTAQQVATALAGSKDARLAENITDGAAYGKYRTWATKVKAKGGTGPVGAEAVVASTNAWLSFALDSETLIENAPGDGDVTIDSFEPTAVGGAFELAVGVEGVYVGEGAAAENLAKLFGLEGGEEIGEMSADKVSVSFGEPTGGKVRLMAGPKDASSSAFFMRVRMTP